MMARLDFQECQERWVQEDFQAQEDLQVCLDHLAYLEPREALGLREMKDLLDHLVPQDKLETRAPLDHRAP